MKNCLLPVALIAASLLTACGKKDAAPVSAPAAAPAPAAAAPAAKAAAAPRVIEITANDQMKFSLATIEAKAGEELKVVLNNVGMLPKEAMGHNWVLLKAGTDVTAFATAAMTAKDTDYVPAAMKDKVIAFIPVLGPKKSADVTFTAPAAGDYAYICSFPGHYMIMKGTLTVK
ncbi:MAG: plastocyanin/azurin family copper-binding protein [Opitutaceae bacterium]|nr:plastocyanin/azurin family copper-binding protein [Opitutaceae bacterium]